MAKAKATGNAVKQRAKRSVKSEVGKAPAEGKTPVATATDRVSAAPPRLLSAQQVAENVIRPGRARSRSRAQRRPVDAGRQADGSPGSGDPKRSSAATAPGDVPSSGVSAEGDIWALPRSVRERFVQDRRRFYFPDGTEAFRDRGRRLTTGSENTEVVRSLVEIAQVRGWGEIVVEGTERFRREAWRQARLTGLEVRGYRPSDAERAMLVRALARRGEGHQLELEVTSPGAEPPASSSAVVRGEGVKHEQTSRPQGDASGVLLVGTLVDHGREHYRFDPKEDPSYFVRVKTAEGPRTIWGKDLERAMSHSLTQPAIGQAVGLRRVGAESVTVRRRELDAAGQVIGEHAQGAKRARWVVEKRAFFEERAAAAAIVRDPAVNRKAAAGAHPELVGTFLQLRAAELASRRLRDPQDQRRFVALVRGALADAVERGEPLQPVRLRSRPGRAPERAPPVQEAERVRS